MIDQYYKLGWLPIPMVPKEKKPLVRWKHMADWTPPFPRDPFMWQGNPGAAILLKPSGLLVIDCDSTEAVNEAISRERHRPCNNIVITSHGAHMYYHRSSDCPPLRRIQVGDCGKIDVLADGYTIAPPSIHPSGFRYEWARSGPLQEAPKWAEDLLREVRTRSIANTALAPDAVLSAPPNGDAEVALLGDAIHNVNPWLYEILSGKREVGDRSRALWLAMNTLIRFGCAGGKGRLPAPLPRRLSDESIAKVLWFGPLGEKPRERGWQWLCDEIARARLELTPEG